MPKRSLILLLLPLLLAGCATPAVKLCAGAIDNASGRELRDIRLVHRPTGQAALCNAILPGASFSVGFQEREMKATSAQIEWTDPKLGRRTAILDLPRTGGSGKPQRLVYTIDTYGWVSVRLVPCP